MFSEKENMFLYWLEKSNTQESFVDCCKEYSQYINKERLKELIIMFKNGTRAELPLDILMQLD